MLNLIIFVSFIWFTPSSLASVVLDLRSSTSNKSEDLIAIRKTENEVLVMSTHAVTTLVSKAEQIQIHQSSLQPDKPQKTFSKVKNWQTAHAKASSKNKATITTKIGGDPKLSFYIKTIAAGSRIEAHYHPSGAEFYLVLSGKGQINVAPLDNTRKVTRKPISDGDTFLVQENVIHQLENTSSHQDLIVLFGCPENHFSGKNRVTTKTLAAHNGKTP